MLFWNPAAVFALNLMHLVTYRLFRHYGRQEFKTLLEGN
jgi:hypothetical protein